MRSIVGDPETLLRFGREQLGTLERDPQMALPWALTLAMSVPAGLLIGVPTGGFGLGLLVGAMAACAIVVEARRRSRRLATETARLIADVHADADHRVELVTKQYEWAVNDVANLRDALRRAKETRPHSAELVRAFRRQAQPVDRASIAVSEAAVAAASIRVEPRAVAAEQVRIVNETGAVVAISQRLLEANADASSAFVMRAGDATAKAIAESDGDLRIEVLVGEQWRPLEKRDVAAPNAPRPEGPVTDKRGRVWTTIS